MTRTFAERLLEWFDQHGRHDLPWQHPITPYRVWVSEIMLQQTQVDTVVGYFQRFIARFGELQQLADAPVDEVLHLWTGLGYYARARNLHRAAQQIRDQYAGEFPSDVAALTRLPGIGESTAAAITSIAFNQPTAILDGNVKRVLARHAAVPDWPGKPAVQKQLWQIARARMPASRCRDYTQAIMDLGATLCTRARARCADCPVQADCQAFNADAVALYPGRKPAKIKPSKPAFMLLAQSPLGVLLEQRPPTGIWGGLWCLPQFDTLEALESYTQRTLKADFQPEHWAGWRHSFSHYHLDITPVHLVLSEAPARLGEPGHLWYNPREPQAVGLAAPVKTLLGHLHANTQPIQKTLKL